MQKSIENLNSTSKNQTFKKSILVIDDSDDMLELLKMILELDGFTVFSAASGSEALGVLNNLDVDLILLDVSLGDMSGLEFLKHLEEKQPKLLDEVPVVFLTGMDTDEVPQSKAAGLIRKSSGTDEILKSVHFYLQNLHTNEMEPGTNLTD